MFDVPVPVHGDEWHDLSRFSFAAADLVSGRSADLRSQEGHERHATQADALGTA
jgi:hypothetical protein